MKHVKVLGLSLVAVFALSAIAVAPASAHEFKAAKYPVKVKGKNSNLQGFEIPGAVSVCTTGTFNTGEEGAPNPTGPSATLEIHPKYTGCTVSIGAVKHVAAEVTTKECNFVFHAAAPNTTEGTVDVKCVGGKSIEIKVTSITGCTISVTGTGTGTNAGLKTVEYRNEPAKEVTANAKASNITWKATSACGLAGTEGNTAKYEEGEVGALEVNKLTGKAAKAVAKGVFGELEEVDAIEVV